jgi:hypothetical protein
MKNISLIAILTLVSLNVLYAEKSNKLVVEKKYLYSWVDRLRVRENPDPKLNAIGYLNEGEKVVFLNVVSQNNLKITLRGKVINAPFYKILTLNGQVGWVFSGALQPNKPKKNPIVYIVNQGTGLEESLKKLKKMRRKNTYGIFFEKNNYILKTVNMIFKKDLTNFAYDTYDISSEPKNPIFIIAGIPNITLKTLDNIKQVKKKFQFPKYTGIENIERKNRSINIFFSNKKYTFTRIYKREKEKLVNKGAEDDKYLYILISEKNGRKIKQLLQESYLVHADVLKTPIVWMGDLDNDNLLDVVLDYEEAGGSREIFLSSYAREKELVHLVSTANRWNMN